MGTRKFVIDNEEALTAFYGRWPSFHDSEVRRIVLERGETGSADLEAHVHVFETTAETDEEGFFRSRNHVVAKLRFGNIADLVLEGFNPQNVLSSLTFEEAEAGLADGRQWRVVLAGIYGVHAEFKCDSIRVVSAEPFSPDDRI